MVVFGTATVPPASLEPPRDLLASGPHRSNRRLTCSDHRLVIA
jgi:hypothetical protein